MKRGWRELNLQLKSVGWVKLTGRSRLFQLGLLHELTAKLELTLNGEEIGEQEPQKPRRVRNQ
jgi:hypothetical protein